MSKTSSFPFFSSPPPPISIALESRCRNKFSFYIQRSTVDAVQLRSISLRRRSPIAITKGGKGERPSIRRSRPSSRPRARRGRRRRSRADATNEKTDHWAQVGYNCFRSDHLAIADGVPEPRRRDPAPGLRRNTPVRYNWVFTQSECQICKTVVYYIISARCSVHKSISREIENESRKNSWKFNEIFGRFRVSMIKKSDYFFFLRIVFLCERFPFIERLIAAIWHAG